MRFEKSIYPHEWTIHNQMRVLPSEMFYALMKLRGIPELDAKDLAFFSFPLDLFKLPNPYKFFISLVKFFDFVRSQYKDKNGQDLRRTINNGLYLRHVFRVAAYSHIFFQALKKKLPINYDILIAVAFLHDAKEMSGDFSLEKLEPLGRLGFSEDQISLIHKLVEILTPEDTEIREEDLRSQYEELRSLLNLMGGGEIVNDQLLQDDDFLKYFLRKQGDFARIILSAIDDSFGFDPYLFIIKAADVFANFDELWLELAKGKRGLEGVDQKLEIFRQRYKIIEFFLRLLLNR